MKHKNITLSEPPFNFDITWKFPQVERLRLVNALNRVKMDSVDEIGSLEERLNEHLSKIGYIWDGTDRESCMLWRPDFRMSVDFYNQEKKIAVEVEKTEVKRIIHDLLKLANASLTFVPKARYGVIIHPMKYRRGSGKESVFASRVASEASFYFKRLISQTNLNDVLFLIYEI